MSDNNPWRSSADTRRSIEPWTSVWRSGYDGPWSSASDRTGARSSLERGPEPTRSSSVDYGSSASATERLRRLRLRTRARYRRALNVSETSQPDSATLLPGRAAVELDRLDEIEGENEDDGDRPPIPFTTCPKSAPAILLPQSPSMGHPLIERRLSMPSRSLSSQSYRGLPSYSARKDIVADKIKSLGHILHHSKSSSQSTTASELRAPLDARERRRYAMDPYQMHSEFPSTTGLFNSPASETALSPVNSPGGVFNPIVKGGFLLATAELDRLSLLANARGTDSLTYEPPTTSSGTSSTGNVPSINPASHICTSTAITSPLQPTNSVQTPAAPTNTPVSDSSPSAPLTVSHSYKYGHRRRAARSRLSEVSSQTEDIHEESGSDPRANAAGLLHNDTRERARHLPLGTVGVRPFVSNRASSPGPRQELSVRNLSSLSAATPTLPKNSKSTRRSRSTTPVEGHVITGKPDTWDPDSGSEAGDTDLLCPIPLGSSLGYEQLSHSEAKSRRTRTRSSTSGTVQVTEVVDARAESSSVTGSSGSEAPLADDGCPQEFARLKALGEKLHVAG